MNDLHLHTYLERTREGLERVRWFPRMLITVGEMDTEHAYFREKLRRHNRYLHGWGVVCGLEATAAPREGSPWCVHVSEGYALGPYGDEIYVPAPGVDLDLANCGPGAATDPCEPDAFARMREPTGGQTLYVAIKFAECLSHPVRAMPPGCGCEEELCEYSRVRDSYEIGCLTDLPLQPKAFSLCDFFKGTKVPACLPCPTEPWVVLARVTLPRIQRDDVKIDNFVRRQIFSTAMLQEAMEWCCCVNQPQPEEKPDLVVDDLSGVGDIENRLIHYSFSVINEGKADAEDVVVTSTITSNHGHVESASDFSSNPSVSWKSTGAPGPFKAAIGSIGKGEKIELRFTVKMNGIPREGATTVKNVVEVRCSTGDSDSTNNREECVTTLGSVL